MVFEGIHNQPFFELSKFPAMSTLQQNYKLIQLEMQNAEGWLKWGSDNYDAGGHCKFLEGNWTIFPIYFGNYRGSDINFPAIDKAQAAEVIASLPTRFPSTTALFKQFPSINFAAFSRLHLHSKLAPHRHNNPLSLIFHLGLQIPAGHLCGLKVGEETHLWTKAGDAVIFDDNLEHSAWNDSEEERVVLYIDFLRYL